MYYLARLLLALATLSVLPACVTVHTVEVIDACEYGYLKFSEVPDDEVLARWKHYEFIEEHCPRAGSVIVP